LRRLTFVGRDGAQLQRPYSPACRRIPRRNVLRAEQGFTLMEFMLAIAVVGVLFAIAAQARVPVIVRRSNPMGQR